MPKSLELQEEYGDDLVVLLVEAQRASRDEMLRFALMRGWLASDALWTKERVVDLPQRGLPGFVLLSHSGRVLLSGSPNALHSKIEEAIEADLRRAARVPDGLSRAVRKALDAARRGRPGKALAALARRLEREDPGSAAGREARTTRDTIVADVERELTRCEARALAGFPREAVEGLEALEQGLRGAPELQERVQTRTAALTADEGPASRGELAAAGDWKRLERRILEEGPDRVTLRRLERFLERHGERRVAARARRLEALCRDPASAR